MPRISPNKSLCVKYATETMLGSDTRRRLWVPSIKPLRKSWSSFLCSPKTYRSVEREQMKRVVLASRNPVKIQATFDGFSKIFPAERFELEGVFVPSNVNEQPLSDMETLQGALNRVRNAMETIINADYWVGIESGIEEYNEEMAVFSWIVVASKDRVGRSKTASFMLPEFLTGYIEDGMELGEAIDTVYTISNSKQQCGAVGVLTFNAITRLDLYKHAIILALIPFKNEKLYLTNI